MSKPNSSLSEVNRSVTIPEKGSWFKRLFAFLGPAYLVSVGYMDPGNWATDIAGGSKYGYQLIWVLLMSNLIALLLQSHSARLGIIRKLDLAQASRVTYPKWINLSLYTLAEIAIAATDLAEVIGFAIGLNLLFNIPILWGVVISLLDTFIILALLNYGIRKIEAFILALVSIIAISFLIQLCIAKPEVGSIISGFKPILPDSDALYIAIGIIGATVMPHNLYLHSALVQSRKIGEDPVSKKKAIRFNFIDSLIALNAAFFVNAAILILAGATFYKNELFEVAEIQDAHKLLEPILGSSLSPVLFAIALIAAGQSSTVTGTLAGQVVMEGYINLRIQPWLRRLITRLLASVPAFFVIYFLGEDQTGKMLIFSQVILSLQLGFAIIPLIHFVSDKTNMGEFSISFFVKIISWLSAAIIVLLNLKLVYESLMSLFNQQGFSILFTLLVIVFVYVLFVLFFVIFKSKPSVKPVQFHKSPHKLILNEASEIKTIAVAVDFSDSDFKAISQATSTGGKNVHYILLHATETVNAKWHGNETGDNEMAEDEVLLENYKRQLNEKGYKVSYYLGFGDPDKTISAYVNSNPIDLLILARHGHGSLLDLVLGTTIDKVRHQVKIPVLIV
jgi:manganese transport protein